MSCPSTTPAATKVAALKNLLAAGFSAEIFPEGLVVKGDNWSAFYADRGQDANEFHGDVPELVEKLAVWDDAATRDPS